MEPDSREDLLGTLLGQVKMQGLVREIGVSWDRPKATVYVWRDGKKENGLGAASYWNTSLRNSNASHV